MENMFEYAAMHKLRFPYKGVISVEDLFDLSRNALDSVYKALFAAKKTEESEESLMSSLAKTKEQEEIEVKLAIVKYVFDLKTKEMMDKLADKEKKEKKQKLQAILASKQDEYLQSMSMEQIQKMLEEME